MRSVSDSTPDRISFMEAGQPTTVEDILNLKDRMVTVLCAVPGMTNVSVFGSCADGHCDKFSDIDIHATTISMDLTLPKLYRALSGIGDIQLEWPIPSDPQSWAATIIFEHLSPLQKLDVSIESVSTGSSKNDQEQANAVGGFDSPDATPSGAYRPEIGSPEHYVISQLLGITRYVKARRRGHRLSCWRFASALVDAVIALEYANIVDDSWVLAGLTTQEYRDADLRLDPLPRDALIGGLDFSNPNAMDRTVMSLVEKLVANYHALESSMQIPDNVLRKLCGCMTEVQGRGTD
jgi:hypothetical protein